MNYAMYKLFHSVSLTTKQLRQMHAFTVYLNNTRNSLSDNPTDLISSNGIQDYEQRFCIQHWAH